jgi:hypothetical protein
VVCADGLDVADPEGRLLVLRRAQPEELLASGEFDFDLEPAAKEHDPDYQHESRGRHHAGISQPDIGQLFSGPAASNSYEDFTTLARQAQGSVGLMRFLQFDIDTP